MGRNSQVERQWRLWRLLARNHRPMACAELAEALAQAEVTPRTVRRDLEVLRRIGVPIAVHRQGREVRYSARDDGPDLRLSREAILALRLALGLLRPFEGTPVGESLAQLGTRLEARLPAPVLAHFSGLVENVAVRLDAPADLRASEGVFQRVREALAVRRVLAFDYRAADGQHSQRRVHPQGLVLGPRGLYLIGRDETRAGELRTFRLERILSARVDEAPASADPSFDPEDYLAGSLGIHSPQHPPRAYRIRLFTEAAALSLRENPWHPAQRLALRRGGGWDLHLVLTSDRELLPRLLALGPDAELLEPADLRAELAALVQAAAARYADSPENPPRRRT